MCLRPQRGCLAAAWLDQIFQRASIHSYLIGVIGTAAYDLRV